MKVKIIFISFVLLLTSCHKKENLNIKFKYFDFTFNNTFETCFSIKFTPNDSVYIREHWNENEDTAKIPKSKTNYIALISKKDKEILSDLISKTQLKNYKESYNEDYSDGKYYTVYIDKDSIKKLIAIHSHKDDVPKDLDSLAKWIYSWKKKVKLIETDKKLTFFSSESVLPPPPPPLKRENK
ncbi:hypothetical protein B0A67_07890 [Flavobacterium aquidurense]|uniref:hypothetical protein n=1 Tax=Flavobacterium aquidurense TaxID=362413 RepID=UPI000919802B|nr:hypothetical protein [Flavobacterium aquidurense]OXA72452.1 hypothetical protein B0A67_07890 [Flavobacterium aquidurense]SHG40852.1 hypothetical protein SAMN05444481_104113 [Flavobacterium frigidimaris]